MDRLTGQPVREPLPPDPRWPRYSTRPFPAYRFIPGHAPHPRRDPRGHSFGRPEPDPTPVSPDRWREHEWYRYGVDLFNFAYWWECHEVFEACWHAAGRQTEPGRFFRALVQVAAAGIKRFTGLRQAETNLRRAALERLRGLPRCYMGMDIEGFATDVRDFGDGRREIPALIRLAGWEDASLPATQYPRSPKEKVGGMVHLGRLFDKIRLRHRGLIHDYNYLTAGFDKYLLDYLGLKGEDLERRVLQGGTDDELLAWVRANGKALSSAEIRLWNMKVLNSEPKDEGAKERYQVRLKEIAAKRGVPVESLPAVRTWVEVIELDEGRM